MIVTPKKRGQLQAGFSAGKVMTNNHQKYSLMGIAGCPYIGLYTTYRTVSGKHIKKLLSAKVGQFVK